MKRTHLLSTAALASALLAAPALAQQRGHGTAGGGAPSASAPTAQDRATAEVDRLHKGNGTNGGPAELLRMAQSAMRRGQTAEANELLERAETRLLLRGGESARPAAGDPAQHIAEARRALARRDRAEAMRHTNLAIATTRDENGATGADAGCMGAQGGGGPGAVDSGMGTLPAAGSGRAVVRGGGTAGTSVTRAGDPVVAQSGGNRGAAGPPARGLPPGDTLPGWSSPGGPAQRAPGGAAASQQGLTAGPALDSNARGNQLEGGVPNNVPTSSSSMTGGEAARVGGAPPSDTSRPPGSSGLSGAGIGTSGVGGPIR